MANGEFSDVWNEHRGSLYATIYYMVGNRHDAENILHDLAVKALQSWPRLRDQKAWLFSVAYKLCRQHYAKRNIEIPMADLDSLLRDFDGIDFDRIAVRAFLAKLPEDWARILWLNLECRYSARQIASLYHMNPKSLSTQLSRIIKKLAQAVYGDE